MNTSKHNLILVGSILVTTVAAFLVYATGFGSSLFSTSSPTKPLPTAEGDLTNTDNDTAREQTAVLAGGCFWCTEASFEQLKGVIDVVSGYAGGEASTADYRSVSAGITDHAEAIRITYDPQVISYGKLLQVFFATAHDPTQLNRQGPDYGKQYRSTIFYQSEREKQVAEAYIQQVDESGAYRKPIATTLEPLTEFYLAEEHHQNYVEKHPSDPYVRQWSLPKIRKTAKTFSELLRDEAK